MYKFFVGVALSLGLWACNNQSTTIHPAMEAITQSVYASGIVKSKAQYDVYAKTAGIVEVVLVKEGDIVRAGQALIKLSNTASTLNYENAKLTASYNSTKSNLEKLEQAKTELALAKSKLDNEASLLERQKQLWAQEIGTKNEIDQRELNYKNATTAYQASKLKLDDLQKQLDFQTKIAAKTASISEVNMNDYIIKSQIAGKVYNINKLKGEMATTQTPIAVIGAADQFYVELQVDEYDISQIKLGQKVLISMDSYKGLVFEAVLDKIYPLMNERTRTFKAEASFTKKPENIFPNLSAEANIIIQVKEKAITIPRSYLIDDSFVLLANKEKRKILVGAKDYEKAEVLTGLSTKDELIKP